MCTATWLLAGDSYSVFFNRDELKTRARALPPQLHEQKGVRYLAPVDPDGGGAWLGVNQFGLTCGVLNNYAKQNVRSSSFRSRGLLVTSLLDCQSQIEALNKLPAFSLNQFRPFRLILFAPCRPPVLCTWDGESLRLEDNVDLPVSSSSFDTLRVVKNRRYEFFALHAQQKTLNSEVLEKFHARHSAKGGAYSVCMHRDEAQTVSFSRINVTPTKVEFFYAPEAPCKKTKRILETLERA